MKDAFNVNDFLGILEQGVKINKRREDKEASVKSVSSKETAPSLEDLFEASEPIETVISPVENADSSVSGSGFKIIDVDDYEDDFESHQNISDDEKRKISDVKISKNGVSDELSKKVQNVKNVADAQFSSEERACSEEDNSDFSADIEISKRTAEKSILKNLNSNLDVKNSSSPTLEPVFESVFDDVVSEVEPVKKDNLDSNISYSSDSASQPVEQSLEQPVEVLPLVSEYPVAISESDLEPCVLYSVKNESWNDAHTDFTFEEEPSISESSGDGDEDDFDVEYEGESELDEMDEVSSGVPQSASGITSVFDEDDDDESVETDIYDVDDFDDEEDEDSEFDDYDEDDFDSESSDDIYDVEDYDDEDEDEDDYEEPASEYDFSDAKSASEVYGNVELEGDEPSVSGDTSNEEDGFEDMETDFDLEDELGDDVGDESFEDVVPRTVVSETPEDEMDVEVSHSVKSKPTPVYKSFDDDDDDEFTRRALERAMGSRVQAKINVNESKKEDVVISDSFEEVVSDETADSVVSVAEEQVEQSVKEKPSVSPKLDSSVDSAVESPSKSLGIRDVSEPEKEEPAVKFVKGMSLKDFLRENPKIRDEQEVLKFFSKADIVQAERRSQIMIRRGKIIL